MRSAAHDLTKLQKLISTMIQKRSARQPWRSRIDSYGHSDSAYTTGIILGSRTPVDCSYCLDTASVDYEPPEPPPGD